MNLMLESTQVNALSILDTLTNLRLNSTPLLSDEFETNSLPHYVPDLSLSDTSLDEHYLTLALIYSRLSMSKRGSMACLFVRPPHSDMMDAQVRIPKDYDFLESILIHSNNTPLPLPFSRPSLTPLVDGTSIARQYSILQGKQIEVHAEARCLSLAAAKGIELQGSTAYITFPPCASCFPLLLVARPKRLVYRRTLMSKDMRELAALNGIELVEFRSNEVDERMRGRAAIFWDSVGETKLETHTRSAQWWSEKGWPALEAGMSVEVLTPENL